jgi:hypothetical protein
MFVVSKETENNSRGRRNLICIAGIKYKITVFKGLQIEELILKTNRSWKFMARKQIRLNPYLRFLLGAVTLSIKLGKILNGRNSTLGLLI